MATVYDMGRQVRWMMSLRVVIVTSLFLPTSILFYEELTGGGSAPAFGLDLRFLTWLMGLTYGMSLLYAMVFRRIQAMERFALLQICTDIVIETGIVYYTGSVNTPFPVLYLVSIIAASILLDRRAALGVASLAVLAYLTLLNLVYWGFLPFRSSIYENVSSIPVQEVLYSTFVSLTGFLATSLLVNYLAERTRRVHAELREVGAELTELQRFNERVIDNLSGGVLVMTPEGRISFLNAPGSFISGYSMADLKGQALAELFPDAGELLAEAVEALRSRKVFRFEGILRARYGTAVPVGASITALPGGDGSAHAPIVGYVLIFQDLTELRKLEEEVRMKEKLAAVGQLAAGMAHEIRNPLASMSGSIQLLKSELALTGEQQRLMEIIVGESRRLSRIIQDFLTFARPPEPKLDPLDLAEILDQTMRLLQHSDEMKPSHELVVDPVAGETRVMADPSQIKQVFWNLALNALHSMPNGGRLHISLDGRPAHVVRVMFRDTGVGMGPERLATLFTPFNSGSPGRSGLGLSIVYGILREHKGRIQVDSAVGRGTTMTVELPRSVVPRLQSVGPQV